MYRSFLFLFILLICFFGCGRDAQFTSVGANFFGDQISPDDALPLSGMTTSLSSSDTLNVKLEGTIEEVCQAKGCWMTLSEGESEVFIRFKDYGFFVPKDASGKKAVVQGKLFNNITSVEEQRHYAEDKGKSTEEIAAITAPKSELRMMAEGVIIYND